MDLWRSAPDTIASFNLQQILSAAGDGDLRDHSICSTELRLFLRETNTPKLAEYVGQCLGQPPLQKGGLILQDLVNELGRRLDFTVEDGRYAGVAGQIGFDGIWTREGEPALIVEVKTTDAYRLSLDTLMGYRRKLIETGKCGAAAAVLIVVGRQDTGELEAQIRGSRHAWDIRLISVESLLRLVGVKENSDLKDVDTKVRGLLRPAEYTRLDALVDVVFSASTDRELIDQPVGGDGVFDTSNPAMAVAGRATSYDFTAPAALTAQRNRIVEAWSRRISISLLKKRRALFWSADHAHRIVCSLSKRYSVPPGRPYWYAYHPAWRDFVAAGAEGHVVLGGMDMQRAFAVPAATLDTVLPYLNTTERPDNKTYWHLHLREDASGAVSLYVPGREPLTLEPFAFDLG